MIKIIKFADYSILKENIDDTNEIDEIDNTKYYGDIESIEDIDYNQLNKIPRLYKNNYTITVDYNILLPDSITEEQIYNIVSNDLKNLKNSEVNINTIQKKTKI